MVEGNAPGRSRSRGVQLPGARGGGEADARPGRLSEPEIQKQPNLTGARILVTGATGFFGQYVVSALEAAGAQAIPLLEKKHYDLLNESHALQAVLMTRPDILVHLAGVVGGLGGHLGQPATLFRDNMLMGMNVTHAAAAGKVKLITVGTLASYPDGATEPIREESLWDGYPEGWTAGFGIAKKALLSMMQAYRRQHRLRFAYLIPSNLYGPGEPNKGAASSVIPALINRFMEAREKKLPEVTCWGTGKAIRSFLYAADAAKALATASAVLDQDDPVNLPGSEERTIGETAAMIAKLVGYEGKILWDENKPSGRQYGVLDGTMAKDLLDWEPETKLADGLKHTVSWYEGLRKK